MTGPRRSGLIDWLRRERILLIGNGPLADEITNAFERAGRPLYRNAEQHLTRRGRDIGATLILTDLSARALTLIRGLAPRRVILVADGREPPAVPSGLADLPCATVAIESTAARALLLRWPLHEGFDRAFGQIPHLVVAGRDAPADALIGQALRLMHYGGERPWLTLVSNDPAGYRSALLAAYPSVNRIAQLRFAELARPCEPTDPPVTAMFVCLRPAARALAVAERLRDAVQAGQSVSPPIQVEIGAAEPGGTIDDWDGQIRPFSYRRMACCPTALLDQRDDDLAQIVHDHYRDTIAAQGRDPNQAPAGRPWEQLDDSYRRASRQQADHLWAKLALCDTAARPEEQVESFRFAPLEVERLAEIEHSRWAADRYLDGWTHGTIRDNQRRHHPQLVPYAELSGPMKDLDRFAVRLTPVLLARFGRAMARMLIIGVPDADIDPGDRWDQVSDRVLARLAERYPDRALVLAGPFTTTAAQTLARLGRAHYDASLFLVAPVPVAETLAAQRDRETRRAWLELVAQVDRRITVPGQSALAEWFARRAQILIRIGVKGTSVARADGLKQVWIDPATGTAEWGFEY
ncbi:RyR domain-containing protein [Thioalkalicoccus limnaeus]|uniref:RyR domain-containing protein n=1 Tax=Thioalkalicoccus limnaeus TaxID=120681 RepID=A0ABV4BEP9_9GAMM